MYVYLSIKFNQNIKLFGQIYDTILIFKLVKLIMFKIYFWLNVQRISFIETVDYEQIFLSNRLFHALKDSI